MADHGATTTFEAHISAISAPIHVSRFELVEGISQIFELQLLITTTEMDVAFADIVGKPASLTIETAKREARYVHGMVSRIRLVEAGKPFSAYSVTIVPTLYKLTHRHDSRIFQSKTVPDILKAVLAGGGVQDVRVALSGSYTARDYCVQYRESDFAFVSRLMEEEGIHYFFDHTDDKHVLVLADAPSAAAPISTPDTVPYTLNVGGASDIDCITQFSSSEEVRPGKVSLTDFNFKKPALSLMSSSSGKVDTDLEIYDYPGEFQLPGDGANYAKVRLEEFQTGRLVVEGKGGCIRMTPGYKFTLAHHPRDVENREYLINRLHHRGSQPSRSAMNEPPSYVNEFIATPAEVPYRPERRTPRPTIKGVQTAIVTGPSGDEIYTDEHGRVKVQFHWDRQGHKDDKSSCWIRVSQLWAGGGWGAMWIPRIGHEVVVDFIEGDPDRPLIIGRVYHGANVPPYALPGEKTKSTIKSNSSLGGGGSNEFRFEDKKGSEEIYLHGQKDWNIKIEHDKNQLVGHDETKGVGNNESYEIGNDQSLTVDHDRTKQVMHDQNATIGNDNSLRVSNDNSVTVGSHDSLSVGGNRSVKVAGGQTESIGGNSTLDVGANLSQSVGAKMSVHVSGDFAASVGASSTTTVTENMTSTVDETYTLTIKKEMNVSVAKNQKVEVQEERTLIVGKKITAQCGDAAITIEKNGNITVEGKKISVKGDGPIEVQGKKLQVKSDGAVNVEASGKVVIKGSNVGVN